MAAALEELRCLLAKQDLPRATWPLYAIMAFVSAPVVFEFFYDQYGGVGPKKTEDGRAGDEDSQSPNRKRIMALDRAVTYRPPIAWPTVLLAMASLGGWSASMWLYTTRTIDDWRAFAISTLCSFVAFTPLHDSVHRAVAPQCLWLNELVGILCGATLFFPHSLFRYIHLHHHSHSNEADDGPAGISLDPDRWAGKGPLMLLPLRWASVWLWYTYWTKKDYIYRKDLAERKGDMTTLRSLTALRDQSFGTWLAISAMLGGLWRWGRDTAPLVCWVAPALASSSFLMYLFDYVPHRPHLVPHREDPYLATSVTKGLFGTVFELDVPMLAQNLHNIHHLAPQVPFYRYRAVWERHREDLVARGTRELPLLLWDRATYMAELQSGKGH